MNSSRFIPIQMLIKLILFTLSVSIFIIYTITSSNSNSSKDSILIPIKLQIQNLTIESKIQLNKVEIIPPGIIVKSKGGLGNQLFRYACSFALAKKLQVPLYILNNLDLSKSLERDKSLLDPFARKEILDKFNIPLDNFIPSATSFYNSSNVFYFNDEHLFYNKITKNSLEVKNKLLIHNDYCQSERFFIDYRDEIKKQLAPRMQSTSFIVKKWRTIIQGINLDQDYESVGIHVRRGDYLTRGRENQYWVTPISFFRTAMDLMQEKYPQKTLQFFVFSDDITYVKKYLLPNQNETNSTAWNWTQNNLFYISSNSNSKQSNGTNSFEDFYLMSQCKNMIVSNSTFSWWAAYLISYKEKVIIGPIFHPKFYDKYKPERKRKYKQIIIGKYWYPPEWIVINPYVKNNTIIKK